LQKNNNKVKMVKKYCK